MEKISHVRCTTLARVCHLREIASNTTTFGRLHVKLEISLVSPQAKLAVKLAHPHYSIFHPTPKSRTRTRKSCSGGSNLTESFGVTVIVGLGVSFRPDGLPPVLEESVPRSSGENENLTPPKSFWFSSLRTVEPPAATEPRLAVWNEKRDTPKQSQARPKNSRATTT